MAPKKAAPSRSPLQIGNCEVIVEANKFTCKLDPSSLEISVNRNTKIKISVKEEINRRCSGDDWQLEVVEKGEEGRTCIPGRDYIFVLVNSKVADSCSKCYLQEVLKIYGRELPAMNYAANTGKQSMFLERCVSNGKYCTLLLKSKFTGGSEEVIAAITYQIVPADTQYAEIPLAAVRSDYQHKGLGRLLYMELRNRLQSVGVRTIYCWGDKESEGFWLKQSFASIAEVDTKGKARRLPIKADIRRSLCYPGGSTLMVSYLDEHISAIPSDLLMLCSPLNTCKDSSLPVNTSIGPSSAQEGDNTLKLQNYESFVVANSLPEGLIKDQISRGDSNLAGFIKSPGGGEQSPNKGREYSKIAGSELAMIKADDDVENCSHCTQGTKKRAWEASLSSLMSKKVKGSHQVNYQSVSSWHLDSENDRSDPCFNGCPLGFSKDSSFVEATPSDPLTIDYVESNAKESLSTNMTPAAQVSKELRLTGGYFRIMLMNIADITKKRHLTEVIEKLGGAVTPDGSVSTHVVTGKVRKTMNFCTALCSGAWIVTSSWLKESFRKGRFVDELPYILHDEDYVLKYRNELKDALLRAKAKPRALLKGYTICIAAHSQPPVETLSAIVRSAGGNVISGLEKVNDASKTIFIACEEEMEEALSAVRKGIWTFSSDWLVDCVMRQELDLEAPKFVESL